MNLNATPTRREKLAYINKNVDMKNETIAEIAKGCQRTATALMEDVKAQGLTFKNERTDDKGNKKVSTCSACVKVKPAYEDEKQEATLPNGQKIMVDIPKLNSKGDAIYNATISISKGNETLQFVCSQYLDKNEEGKDVGRITSVSWSEFNKANPSASPRAKGVDEISKSDKVSPELKAIAVAVEQKGYIKGYSDGVKIDESIDKNDARANELAKAMASTMRDVVKAMKEQNKLFDVTVEKDGKSSTFPVSAYVKVNPAVQKDGTPILNRNGEQYYHVQASFRKGDENLTLSAYNHIDEESKKVGIYKMELTDFTGGKNNSVTFSGNKEIQKSPVSPEIKALADALDKSGFIIERSELYNFSYHLNTEVFKTKVMVEQENPETGKMEDVEKKLLNAKYRIDDNKNETVTIFNKSKDDTVRILLSESEQYGKTVTSYHDTFTPILDKDGKPTSKVRPKENKDEKSAFFFINSAEDVANFTPALPELQQAISEYKGIDLEEIKDAVKVLEAKAVAEQEVSEVSPAPAESKTESPAETANDTPSLDDFTEEGTNGTVVLVDEDIDIS